MKANNKLCAGWRPFIICVLTIALCACATQPPDARPAAPESEPQKVSPAMTDSPAGFYRANAGDTVSSVASRLSIDPALLARRNGLSADAKLDAGELLRVTPMKATECSSNASSLVWPADGPVIRAFGSDGAKSIAIGGALGDPVKAAGAGRVIYAGNKIEGYGNLIVIKHDENLLTAYGNGRRILVKEGTTVRRGQVIAEMGDRVTGKPALLFEVRKNRAAVDPMQFLPAACAAQK